MLIDSHAHLDDERIISDLSGIISNMEKNQLEGIVTVGCDRKTSQSCFDIATNNKNIYATVGIHPHEAQGATQEDYDLFVNMAKNEKVVGIGEIGLDYYYDFSPREVQKKVFIEQMELAHFLKLPMVFHLRDAYQDMLNICKEKRDMLEYGAILHCYSGSKEIMQEFAKLGLYFSYGGAITFKNAVDKPEIVRNTPKDRILVETDCPYMTPVPFRGKTNYPQNVCLVAEKMASIFDCEVEKIHELTLKNTKDFFKRIK